MTTEEDKQFVIMVSDLKRLDLSDSETQSSQLPYAADFKICCLFKSRIASANCLL